MHGLAQSSIQLSIRPSIDCYYRDQEKILRHEKTGGANLEIAVHLGKSSLPNTVVYLVQRRLPERAMLPTVSERVNQNIRF